MIKLRERFTFNKTKNFDDHKIIYYKRRFHVISKYSSDFLTVTDDFKKEEFRPVSNNSDINGERLLHKINDDDQSTLCLWQDNLLFLPSRLNSKSKKAKAVSLRDYSLEEKSFMNIYRRLETHFPDLTIQGALIKEKTIRLFHKREDPLSESMMIDMDLDAFLKDQVKDLKFINFTLPILQHNDWQLIDTSLCENKIIFLSSLHLNNQGPKTVIGSMTFSGEVIKLMPLDLSYSPLALTIKDHEFFIKTVKSRKGLDSKIFSGDLLSLLKSS